MNYGALNSLKCPCLDSLFFFHQNYYSRKKRGMQKYPKYFATLSDFKIPPYLLQDARFADPRCNGHRFMSRKCENAKMRKCENAKVRKCETAKVRKCESAKMRICENAKMRKCENAKMRKC